MDEQRHGRVCLLVGLPATRFFFNENKAAQAAAYLVRLNGGQMNVMSLIKILYLADRRALVLRGRPITGDEMVSMPHGPVLSRIYDEIKWGAGEEGQGRRPWYDYLTERQSDVVALQEEEPPTDELSNFERQILQEAHGKYGHFGPWDLRRLTHGLPEYDDPRGSSFPIDPIVILRAEGWSDSDIQEALMDAREEMFLCQLGAASA